MGFRTPSPLILERVRFIDWYDGPVTALVSEASTGPWLGLLQGALRGARIYGLTRTTAEHTAAIDALLEERQATPRWPDIQRRFHIALAESDGPLVLLRGESLEPGRQMEQTEVDWDSYRSRVTFSVDDAVDSSRAKLWTAVFDDALHDDQVRDRFRQWCASRGFGLIDTRFSISGHLMVSVTHDVPGGVRETWVDIDTDGERWQLRVRTHDGTHWRRTVATEDEARRVVEGYLGNPTRPPGNG